MTPSERLFRALVRLCPASTHDGYGDDTAQLFTGQLRVARTPAALAGPGSGRSETRL
ncbi:MAG: hypothetical protein ABIR11_11060 [Candidatus Limnocylindrales bacterium]